MTEIEVTRLASVMQVLRLSFAKDLFYASEKRNSEKSS